VHLRAFQHRSVEETKPLERSSSLKPNQQKDNPQTLLVQPFKGHAGDNPLLHPRRLPASQSISRSIPLAPHCCTPSSQSDACQHLENRKHDPSMSAGTAGMATADQASPAKKNRYFHRLPLPRTLMRARINYMFLCLQVCEFRLTCFPFGVVSSSK